MISTPHRQTAAGAEHGMNERTLRCWTKGDQGHSDQHPIAARREPANKLRTAEPAAVLDVCNSKEFASIPPSGVSQHGCPPISCGVSDYRGVGCVFGVEPNGPIIFALPPAPRLARGGDEGRTRRARHSSEECRCQAGVADGGYLLCPGLDHALPTRRHRPLAGVTSASGWSALRPQRPPSAPPSAAKRGHAVS